MQIKIVTQPPNIPKFENLVLGFFSDEKPPRGFCGLVDWRLNGAISRELAAGRIAGASGEQVAFAFSRRLPVARVLLLGMGPLTDLTYDALYEAGYQLSKTMSGMRCNDFAFSIPGAGRCSLLVATMTEAVVTGCFDFFSKTKEATGAVLPCLLTDDRRREQVIEGLNKFKMQAKGDMASEIFEVTMSSALAEVL
ncbi:MAG: hypothetical protein HY742_04150 [Deltaproteobacteria bacterium]|nr:hypothetical protein [Deltaproteobacteria bacterium]